MTYFWCLSLHYMFSHTVLTSSRIAEDFSNTISSIVINAPDNHHTHVVCFFSNAVSSLSYIISYFKLAHQLCLPVFKIHKHIVVPTCIWSVCFQWLKIYAAGCWSHIVLILYFLTQLKKKKKNWAWWQLSWLIHKMDVIRALVK